MLKDKKMVLWGCLCLLMAVTFFIAGKQMIAGIWLVAFAAQLVMVLMSARDGKN